MNETVSGRSIDVNGAALYYEEHGDGAPLILIHGGLSSGSSWDPVVPELADRFRVITPDSRGHGRSTNPLDLSVSLYRALPDAELAVCPRLSHDGPTPERAKVLASLLEDFAPRHTETDP